MKKIITAIMLLALIALPMFAATQDSNLNVKTTVGTVNEYGFFPGAKYNGLPTAELAGMVGSDEQVLTGDGATYSVVVRTNSNSGVKVSIYSTPLQLKSDDVVIDSIPLKIDGAVHGDDAKLTKIDKSEGKSLRIEQAKFTLAYDADVFAAATVGDYKATVTMEVSGV